MASKYRIEAVEITGFKAFTSQQKITISGKTTFVFGENGLGKSSMIEAIVWCLFGTEGDVRNKFFDGTCSVNLYLRETGDSSKIYRIKRTMHRIDNSSDVDVSAPDGTHPNFTDFIPQLAKLEHGSATKVIFAEQESGARYSYDFDKFEALLAAYLGLAIPYHLTDTLNKFIEDKERIFDNEVGSKNSDIESKINERLNTMRTQINAITNYPPWDSQLPPSESETMGKITSLLKEILALKNENKLPNDLSLEQLLQTCTSEIEQIEKSSQSDLNDAISNQNKRIDLLTKLRASLVNTNQNIQNLEAHLKKTSVNLTELLGNKSESELAEEKERLEIDLGPLNYKVSMVQHASHLVENGAKSCPLCNTALGEVELKKQLDLRNKETENIQNVKAKIDQISEVLKAVSACNNEIKTTTAKIGSAKQDKSDIENNLARDFELQKVSPEIIDTKLIEMQNLMDELQQNVRNKTAKFNDLNSKLTKFKQTVTYHRLIRYGSKLDKFINSEEYTNLSNKIAEFNNYIHALKGIKEAIEDAYVNNLTSYLPSLNNDMTTVWRSLTKQKSFDSIRISLEPSNEINKTKRKMVLQVGDKERNIWVEPSENVLNGQSFAALKLVPYFAFSKIGRLMHEIDFLLIDDPSQSYDTTHMELLLDYIKNVANDAQVIIATHERDRMEGKLLSFFKDYNIINVSDFDKNTGPRFAYGNSTT